MAINDALALYCTHQAPRTASAARTGYAIARLVQWWGERPVSSITAETTSAYIEARRRARAAVSTAARELIVLRAAVRWCAQNGHLNTAPFVRLPPKTPGRERWLTRSEAAALLRASRRDPRARLHLPLFILIALYTGARRGAILGLRWSQVDLERRRIDFNEPGRPITKKRRAVIPIPEPLVPFLRAASRRSNNPFVISYLGAQVKLIRRSFRSAVTNAGLGREVTPHVLRHTCGTWLAQAGVPLYQVAGWLGHSYERTTELYAHHHPDHLEDARRAIERRPNSTKWALIPPTFSPT